jgi:hypothetical protein
VDDWPRHPNEPQPGEYKTACDGTGGLVRVRLIGPPHEGRSLYIDELDLPAAIWTTGTGARFEWWTDRQQGAMSRRPAGSDPAAPPVRHRLVVPEDTRIPVFQSEAPVAA